MFFTLIMDAEAGDVGVSPATKEDYFLSALYGCFLWSYMPYGIAGKMPTSPSIGIPYRYRDGCKNICES